MEFIKEHDAERGFSFIFKDEFKKLEIGYSEEGDLLMSMTEGRMLDNRNGDSIYIDIHEDDGNVYDVLYNLYSRIMLKRENHPTKLVDIEKYIVWLDDDKNDLEADKFMIQNYGDILRLKFVRTSDPHSNIFKHKNYKNINIKFSMKQSRYPEYVDEFAKLYRDLSRIEERKVYKR